jgi:hypothetical protein
VAFPAPLCGIFDKRDFTSFNWADLLLSRERSRQETVEIPAQPSFRPDLSLSRSKSGNFVTPLNCVEKALPTAKMERK